MTNPGIDYGMGTTNRDAETGIRYGVISQHSVGQAWYDSAEADYGNATCPKCGNEACDFNPDIHDNEELGEDSESDESEEWSFGHGCTDYACERCRYVFDSSEAFGEEPCGWNFEDSEYTLTDCLDSDIFVLKSPYYTLAPYCSPCVPGAGNLNSANEHGVKTFCLGHDWFENEIAPYDVYRVSDDSLVLPSADSILRALFDGESAESISEALGLTIEEAQRALDSLNG